jgi:hypothetical protein
MIVEENMLQSHSKIACEDVSESNPILVELFALADRVHEDISAALDDLAARAETDVRARAIQRFGVFYAVLYLEMSRATCCLVLHGFTRAAASLFRNLVEYRIRFDYLADHGDGAVEALRTLPTRVYNEEDRRYPGKGPHPNLQAAYAAWLEEHPDCAKAPGDVPFETAFKYIYERDRAGDRVKNDNYLLYGRPSLITHGKVGMLEDVLHYRKSGDGTEEEGLEFHLTSRTIVPEIELFRLIAVGIDFDALVSRIAGRLQRDFTADFDGIARRWNEKAEARIA